MKDRINRYARGVFDYEQPKLDITEYYIEKRIDTNSTYKGTLCLNVKNDRVAKGIVHSTNSQVKLIETGFDGNENTISYYVDASEIDEKRNIEGKFEIVSDAGEYEIAYLFKVTEKTVDTSIGEIKNLFHFANLAQFNPEQAEKLFVSDYFKKVFVGNDVALLNIYEGLIMDANKHNALEEFLVAIHKKTRVRSHISKSQINFDRLYDTVKDSIVIYKDVWGYVEYNVSTDADFIRLEDSHIDSEQFAANKYELEYYVDYDKLHAGKNFGKIIIENDYQKIECAITATRNDYMPRINSEYKRYYLELIKVYIDFRTKKIDFAKWIQISMKCIRAMQKLDNSDMYIKLFEVHLLLAQKDTEKAKELIDSVKEAIYEYRHSNVELYSFLLYENSLFNKDAVYASQVCQTVKEYFEKDYDRWQLLWILCYLDEENEKNKSLKLIRIKEQFQKGCHSPIMYIEALNAFNEMPTLLRVINEFELQVINFGCKQGAISEKLAMQIADVAQNSTFFNKTLFNVLATLYKMYENTNILTTMCTLLIRYNKLGPAYYPWYAKSIALGLKITSLYENYLYSRMTTDMSPLPKMLLMYFKYNNSLDYTKMAYLLANVILNKNKNLSDFENYRPIIERFAFEQLEKQRINDDLAIIYNLLLSNDNVVKSIGEKAFNTFFVHKFECKDERVKCVIIRHKELDVERKIPFVNGVAYGEIFTNDALVMLETYSGRRYINTIPYVSTMLLDADHHAIAADLQEDNLYKIIYLCEYNNLYQNGSKSMIDYYKKAVNSIQIKGSYKNKLVESIIEYYYDNYENENIELELANIDIETLSQYSKVKYLEICIMSGLYDKASQVISKVAYEQINSKRLLKLCSRLANEEKVNENLLVSLAIVAYRDGKYDENTLKVLNQYYNGSTKEMVDIYNSAKSFYVETPQLAERIIEQALFSGVYVSKIFKIFRCYYDNGAKERLLEAFIGYYAYNYFVKLKMVDEIVFELIEGMVYAKKDVILVAKLALLKYYSELHELSEERISIVEELITELARGNIVFDFYRKFSDKITLPYNVIDKTVIEYRTNPKNRVVIHYLEESNDDMVSYVVEDMHHIIEGIFIKQFVVFYGEEIKYYITEEYNEKEELTESSNILNETIEYSEGRFDKINDMLIGNHMEDIKSMRKMVSNYTVLNCITDKLFEPIS